jgi:hypothetical protein
MEDKPTWVLPRSVSCTPGCCSHASAYFALVLGGWCYFEGLLITLSTMPMKFYVWPLETQRNARAPTLKEKNGREKLLRQKVSQLVFAYDANSTH